MANLQAPTRGMGDLAEHNNYLVAGVIRNDWSRPGPPADDFSYWTPIREATHRTGFWRSAAAVGEKVDKSVETTTSGVVIWHDQFGPNKVTAMTAHCDETLSALGYRLGTSVGAGNTTIKFYRSHSHVLTSGASTGAAWSVGGGSGLVDSAVWDTDGLLVTHDELTNSADNCFVVGFLYFTRPHF